MSFTLQPRRTVPSNLRRIAADELASAMATARDATMPVAERIHAARTRCKKVRALLLLVADGFPAYRTENSAIRDAAAALSHTRDSAVMAETLAKLLPRIKDIDAFEAKKLEVAIAVESVNEAQSQAILDGFVATIEPVLVRLQLWHPIGLDWAAVAAGAGKVYSKGREAQEHAAETTKSEDFHVWRKQVKYHWFHLTLLRKLAPDGFAKRRKRAKTLGTLLGEHHDIEVLLSHLSRTSSIQSSVLTRVGRSGHRQQLRLAGRAKKLGDKLFDVQPKKWRHSLEDLIAKSGARETA